MTRYKNGEVPASVLVKRGVFLLPAGTWAKWDALVADVKARFGVTLYITSSKGNPGSGAYRALVMQQAMKDKHGSGASAVGFSSHGGTFKGRDAMAVDVSNYGAIPLAEFFAAARRAGFEANYYDGNGKPFEPWHLIDNDPYRKAAPAKPSATPAAPTQEDEEDDMRFKFGHRKGTDTDEWMIVHPSLTNGYQVTTDQKRAIAWARLYGAGWQADETARYDFNLDRAEYIDLQNAAKAVAKSWQG